MAQKLTPWFPPEVKPVRKGVYIATVDPRETFYRYWDGKFWLVGSFECEYAKSDKPVWRGPPIHWRGLATPPKGAK